MNNEIENIRKAIDGLVVYTELGNLELNEEIAYTQEKLYEALNSSNKFDKKNIFENYVWQDCDPLNKKETKEISDLDSFVEKVRDIQNDIIDVFFEFDIAYFQETK